MLRLLEGVIFIRNEREGGLDANADGLAQDRYSLRCLPQFIGPIVEGLWQMTGQIETEMNPSNDNPLIDVRRQVAYHGGNFLGQYVGMAMDQMGPIGKTSGCANRPVNGSRIQWRIAQFVSRQCRALNQYGIERVANHRQFTDAVAHVFWQFIC